MSSFNDFSKFLAVSVKNVTYVTRYNIYLIIIIIDLSYLPVNLLYSFKSCKFLL